jgi:predicted permease
MKKVKEFRFITRFNQALKFAIIPINKGNSFLHMNMIVGINQFGFPTLSRHLEYEHRGERIGRRRVM